MSEIPRQARNDELFGKLRLLLPDCLLPTEGQRSERVAALRLRQLSKLQKHRLRSAKAWAAARKISPAAGAKQPHAGRKNGAALGSAAVVLKLLRLVATAGRESGNSAGGSRVNSRESSCSKCTFSRYILILLNLYESPPTPRAAVRPAAAGCRRDDGEQLVGLLGELFDLEKQSEPAA